MNVNEQYITAILIYTERASNLWQTAIMLLVKIYVSVAAAAMLQFVLA